MEVARARRRAGRASTTPTTPTPTRCASALETLARMGGRGGRRTVAVLGEMRELGAERRGGAPRGRAARRTGSASTSVVVVGDGAVGDRRRRSCEAVADGTTRHVETVDEAAAWLRENVGGPGRRAGEGVPRSGRLERVAGRCSSTTRTPTRERSPAVESDPAGRRPVAGAHPGRHPLRHPGARQARLRPADPRRRPDHPPHQARHAHDGRPGDRAGLGARLLPGHAWSPGTRRAPRRCC